jgi:MFS family permease
MSQEPGSFRVRSLSASVYLPNLLFAIGQGATVPVVALLALELGASPAMAGIIVALRGVGTLLFDLPAGVLVARLGERRAMIVAGVALALASLAVWLEPSLLWYAVLTTVLGATWAVWLLARIAFAAGSSPNPYRGRVMAMIGGVHRMGLLIGPLLGSLVIARGDLSDPFLVMAVLSLAAAIAMAVAKSPEFTPEPEQGAAGAVSTRSVIEENRHVLLTAGSVAVIAQVLRSSREALIPLWGDQLGIAAATIPLIFAASSAVETLLFYPVGLLMDRKGRKWAALPAIGLLSVGVAAIPLTAGVAGLTAVALLLGVANGLGSGMNMTLGSDFSPLAGRSRFLGVWRLVTDVGTVGGPLLVAAVTSVATLGAAALSVAGVGVVGVVVLWRAVPETLESPDRGDGP